MTVVSFPDRVEADMIRIIDHDLGLATEDTEAKEWVKVQLRALFERYSKTEREQAKDIFAHLIRNEAGRALIEFADLVKKRKELAALEAERDALRAQLAELKKEAAARSAAKREKLGLALMTDNSSTNRR